MTLLVLGNVINDVFIGLSLGMLAVNVKLVACKSKALLPTLH